MIRSKETMVRFFEVMEVKGIEVLGEYMGTGRPVRLMCGCGHEWDGIPSSFTRTTPCGGCVKCKKKVGRRSLGLSRLPEVLKMKGFEETGCRQPGAKKIELRCLTCGSEWVSGLRDYLRTEVRAGCRKCSSNAQRKPNTWLLTWEGVVKLDISSPAHPEAVMLIDRDKWEIYTRVGIGRVGVGVKGYPVATWQGKRVFIHRLVMGFPKEVDHVNGIKWDNRTCNLREATALQNQMNRGLRKTNKSGVIGVYEKKPGVWEACLKVGRKRVHQSSHKSLEAASAARAEAVRQHCGEFAPVLL